MFVVSLKEAAKMKGVTSHAVQYQVAKGHINSKRFPTKGKKTRVFVIVDEAFKLWSPKKDKRRLKDD